MPLWIPARDVTRPLNCTNNNELFSFYPGGSNVVLADSSAHIVPDDMSPVFLRQPSCVAAESEAICRKPKIDFAPHHQVHDGIVGHRALRGRLPTEKIKWYTRFDCWRQRKINRQLYAAANPTL